MATASETLQRIGRLTPLADVLAAIDRLVRPVTPRRTGTAVATGCTLAADVRVEAPHPPRPLALRDGWAVRSEDTIDAGSYAPAVLSGPLRCIEAGDPMPDGTDAVADVDTVRSRAAGWETLAGLAPGDGVWGTAADAAPGPVARAGRRLRRTDIAALERLEIPEIDVREPRIRLGAARPDAGLDAIVAWLADVAWRDGAAVDVAPAHGAEAVLATTTSADLIVVVGGTGTGARDDSVTALARAGRVEAHGVALAPGETVAFGMIDTTPVIAVPGRFDAALAVWLTIGRHLLGRLCGRIENEPAASCVLSRKVTSNLGLAEIVALGRDADGVAPLASGCLALSALTQADGYMVVPPASEGYPAGTRIDMRFLP